MKNWTRYVPPMPAWLRRILRSRWVLPCALVFSGMCAGLCLGMNYTARQSATTFMTLGSLITICYYQALLRVSDRTHKRNEDTIRRYAAGQVTMLKQIDELLLAQRKSMDLIASLQRDLDSEKARAQDGGMH